jgi:hypothetical protein
MYKGIFVISASLFIFLSANGRISPEPGYSFLIRAFSY